MSISSYVLFSTKYSVVSTSTWLLMWLYTLAAVDGSTLDIDNFFAFLSTILSTLKADDNTSSEIETDLTSSNLLFIPLYSVSIISRFSSL